MISLDLAGPHLDMPNHISLLNEFLATQVAREGFFSQVYFYVVVEPADFEKLSTAVLAVQNLLLPLGFWVHYERSGIVLAQLTGPLAIETGRRHRGLIVLTHISLKGFQALFGLQSGQAVVLLHALQEAVVSRFLRWGAWSWQPQPK